MRLAIIGAGVIGERRALAMPKGIRVGAVVDINEERAWALAQEVQAKPYNSIETMLSAESINGAVIATINSAIVPTAQSCLERGIHVLLEKPAARSYDELRDLQNPKNCTIKIGFNHRFHPAYEDILLELAKNPNDPVMYVRARYGNGARVGFDTEWRSKVELAGGGEMMDQGVHVLDLANRILPELEVQTAYSRTHFWKMPVDDNTWGILSNTDRQTFAFHVSSSEWKNEFQFDVYTKKRRYTWQGLGRSYGPETLTIYKMKPEMGPPDVEKRDYPPDDFSWLKENKNFIDSMKGEAQANGDIEDALKALYQVSQVYKKSYDVQSESGDHPRWHQE